MNQTWKMWALFLVLCAFAPLAGAIYLIFFELKPVYPTFVAACALFVYFVPFWALLIQPLRIYLIAVVARWGSKAWWILPVSFLVPNLVFRLVLGSGFLGILNLGAFLFLPTFVLWIAQRQSRHVNWWDFVALIIIWLPFDTGWLLPVWQLDSFAGLESINSILAVGYFGIVFLYLRRLKGIGFEPRFQKVDQHWAAIGIVGSLIVILPLGLATDFITYNGEVWPWRMFGAGFGILLLIAIPEELLFRGFMQNALLQKFKHPSFAIGFMSLFFGIIHANNGPSPDWRFMLLASVVGLFCGIAHYRSQNLTSPVLIHTFVDAMWVGYLQ